MSRHCHLEEAPLTPRGVYGGHWWCYIPPPTESNFPPPLNEQGTPDGEWRNSARVSFKDNKTTCQITRAPHTLTTGLSQKIFIGRKGAENMAALRTSLGLHGFKFKGTRTVPETLHTPRTGGQASYIIYYPLEKESLGGG